MASYTILRTSAISVKTHHFETMILKIVSLSMDAKYSKADLQCWITPAICFVFIILLVEKAEKVVFKMIAIWNSDFASWPGLCVLTLIWVADHKKHIFLGKFRFSE